jgi:hypothetical protein
MPARVIQSGVARWSARPTFRTVEAGEHVEESGFPAPLGPISAAMFFLDREIDGAHGHEAAETWSRRAPRAAPCFPPPFSGVAVLNRPW